MAGKPPLCHPLTSEHILLEGLIPDTSNCMAGKCQKRGGKASHEATKKPPRESPRLAAIAAAAVAVASTALEDAAASAIEPTKLAQAEDEVVEEDTRKEAPNKTLNNTASTKEAPGKTPNNTASTKETPDETPNNTASTNGSYK
jgi:hypothetical protein